MKPGAILALLLTVTLAFAGPRDDPVAQKKLGDAAWARQDFVGAERAYRQAANQGNLDAAVALANVLMRDTPAGKKADVNEAAQWYLFALGNGRKDVYYPLARCYDNGWGVKRSLVEAYKWYSLVADTIPAAKTRMAELAQTLTPHEIAEAQRRAHAYREPSSTKTN